MNRFDNRAQLLKAVVSVVLGATASFHSASAEGQDSAKNATQPQRIVSAGHSFHMFVPPILSDIADKAGIKNHTQVARQGIGASYVHQHWDVPDDENPIKKALKTGKVDVLCLSPIYLPDDGIEDFSRLALNHNPDIRITVQEFWLPYDVYAKDFKKKRPARVDRNARTAKEIRALHADYFTNMDEHVRKLNKQLERRALFVVPVGQAVILLREKIIAGEAPGLRSQEDLFRDAIGHPNPPLRALVAYCYYSVIYRRSPVGLGIPDDLRRSKNRDQLEELNRLLQQLAWQAAREHPLSGVKDD